MPKAAHVFQRICALLAAGGSLGMLAGWGEDGHRIISDLAQARLTPAASSAVRDLLDGQSLADICTWADQVRPQLQYAWSAPMHYINLPDGAATVDLARDCADKDGRPGCVVAAIRHYSDVLRDASAPREDRIEALKFMVHFVEDVHQPLHVSYARDRGGNDIKLTFNGRETNLHKVWDSDLIGRAMELHGANGQKESWEAYRQRIELMMTPERIAIWSNLDAASWAEESWRLTNDVARKIPADNTLTDVYYHQSIGAVDERLCMGGARLAALLNDIFAAQDPAADPPGAQDSTGQPRAPATAPAPASPTPSPAEAPAKPHEDPAS